jgi:hypothetical protein
VAAKVIKAKKQEPGVWLDQPCSRFFCFLPSSLPITFIFSALKPPEMMQKRVRSFVTFIFRYGVDNTENVR